MSATCRTCGAPIVWIVTPAGKAHPVDAKPEKRWIVQNEITDGPTAGLSGTLVDTYVSHFATCPQAAEHRRKP